MDTVNRVVITGATGNVGVFATLSLARLGVVDELFVAARNPEKVNDVFYNSQVNSLMRGHATKFHSLKINIENDSEVENILGEIKPTLVLNCAAGLSLYPFFPALRSRQKRMGMIPGFSHTLPKDMLLLYPLMKGIRKSCPETLVVNLSAPDIASYILSPLGLSPDIGAGTLDSTVQGVRLKLSNDLNIIPTRIDVLMVAHHALRRYPANQVPYAIQISVDGKDVTSDYSAEDIDKLINFATDTTGVETENSPMSSNSYITAASGVETTYAILTDSRVIRHGSGFKGTSGAMPINIARTSIEPILPKGLSYLDAQYINDAGMRLDGLDYVDSNGKVYFTEKESEWIKDGLGLDWGNFIDIENSKQLCDELTAAYILMRKEENV